MFLLPLFGIVLSSLAVTAIADRSDVPPGYDLDGPLQGCSEVACPDNGQCTLQDQTYTGLGVTNFTSKLTSDPFNWIIATRIYDQDTEESGMQQAFEKKFFVATPPSFSLSVDGLGGCALFFADEDISFISNDRQRSSGTCDDALSSGCVSALSKQANDAIQNINLSSVTLDEACQKLLDEFKNNDVVQECWANTRTQWSNVQAKGFTGASAPAAITQDTPQDCHPTSPNTNTLSPVWSQNITDLGSDAVGQYLNIVPILTVFFGNGSNSSLDSPETHLSCLKPTGFTEDDLSSLSDGTGNGTQSDGGSGVGRAEVPQFAILGFLVLASMIPLFL